MNFIETIQKFLPDDQQLAQLFERVQEYAELYLIAKQRQKGCDGMGEVATLKDEFIYSLNKIIQYCKEKGYTSGEISYEIDSIAYAVSKNVEND
jgi:hypothetical protein